MNNPIVNITIKIDDKIRKDLIEIGYLVSKL